MKAFFDGILSRLQEIFDPELLGAQFAELLANLIVGTLTFAAFYLLWRVLHLVVQSLIRRARLDETTTTFAAKTLKYTVLTIGAISALAAMGINMTSVVASLGITGLTIGFAARDALSNLISGLLIFWDRPFVIGDLIEIGGQYGRVSRITLRSTRIVTSDGKMLAVPNSDIINKTVASYTNFPHLRLDVAVTVAVTEDLNHARRVLLDIVRGDPDYLDDPPPRVVITQLNDYNVGLELQVWIEDERTHLAKRFELREKVFDALRETGVEMPFETIQLTPLEVRVSNGAGLDR